MQAARANWLIQALHTRWLGCSIVTEAPTGQRVQSRFVYCDKYYLESQTRQTVDRAEIYARHRRRWTELSEAQHILPGGVDCIAGAKRQGLQIGLASSGRRDWVVGHLSRLGLEADFDCIKCLEDVSTAKPGPELYLSALSEMAVAPGQAIALEDSPNGILAAKRAGLYCVVVPNPMTRHLPLDQADLRLDSLADVSLESLLTKAGSSLR